MGPEITWQAGVMDMVSTTGVEVMTEVVTEASVGEAALISLPVRFILYIYIHICKYFKVRIELVLNDKNVACTRLLSSWVD